MLLAGAPGGWGGCSREVRTRSAPVTGPGRLLLTFTDTLLLSPSRDFR